MNTDQWLLIAILAGAIALFLSGRLRHDIVALAALMAAVLAGLVPADQAFAAFGHPAVITVAAVLVLSRGLYLTGAVDLISQMLLPKDAGIGVSLAMLLGLAAGLSAFMNNVGALALLMPIAISTAQRLQLAPGQVLMPLSFATILGGMVTLVGTPPNLIVAGFRAQNGGTAFGMFDFTPVGLAVALVALAVVVLGGWRLVPARTKIQPDAFDTGAYLTEVRVLPDGKAAQMTVGEIEAALSQAGAQLIALVRAGVYLSAPRFSRAVHAEDVIVIEADVATLPEILQPLNLALAAAIPQAEDAPAEAGAKATEAETTPEKSTKPVVTPSDLVMREYVVRPDSEISGSTVATLSLRSAYGINLLAVSRSGMRAAVQLRNWRLRAGDLVLLQGPEEALASFAAKASFLPLAGRDLRLPQRRMAYTSLAILAVSVGLAAFGLLPAEIAFSLGLLASVLLGTVPARALYPSIDWSVIVLLAALIPVAGAMESTGTADVVAQAVIATLAEGRPVLALALVLIVTMTLSDVMNNAATAAVMCPIAISVAKASGANADPFLMAVAIGASCAFLTPIGHQNNTLILGPGGFRFGDYWRLGIVMEAVVAAVSIPLLLVFWPL
jgi:di/tricarboxylate transporter